MSALKLQQQEKARLEELKSYRVLDTLPEREFDDLTRIASYICNTPIALISLLDETRQWFKSRHGLSAPSTARDIAFCEHTIRSDQVMIIEDSFKDERFCNNPLATHDPNVRFYAGAPLITPQGYRIGTICVIDHVPRMLTAEQTQALEALSRQVISQLELTRAKNEAVAAHRVKTEFLANMSHEIRTPLNGIIGMTEIIMDEPLAVAQKERLQIIQSCGNSLLSLINDILDFSKLESGKVTFESIPFNLRQTVSESLEIFKVTARQKNLRLHVTFAENLPEKISGDPHRLRQILNNLVGNALKFTSQGEIRVEVGSQSLGPLQAEIRIGVHDSGRGIPVDLQNQLFRSFAQADASTTRKYGGTGLGLAICKGLCETMGGDIWLESKSGQGSSFFFSLPVQVLISHAEESSEARQNEPRSIFDASNLKVLLAEDNRINQMVVTGLLARFGCQPDIAENGREAICKSSEKEYDLILMDCHMPEVDGFAAALEITSRESFKTSQKPPRIVALTASASAEDRKRCLENGMVDFLTKPIRLKNLEAILAKASTSQASESIANIEIEPLDVKTLKARFEGIEEVFPLALESFYEDLAIRLEGIQTGLVQNDARAVQLAAHSIKGMTGEFHALRASELANRIEQNAKAGRIRDNEEILADLCAELKRVEMYLEKLVKADFLKY